MIKINLLPRVINEKAILRNTAILFGGLVVAVALIGILYTQLFLIPQVRAEEELAAQTEALEKEVMAIESQTSSWKNKTVPVQKKLDFIQNVIDYNLKYPALYEEVAKWTYEKVAYVGLACDGAQVTIAGRVKNLEDLGRYLLNMYRARDLFTEVRISGVPGYPMGASSGGGGFSQQSVPSFGGGGEEASLAGIGAISASIQNAPPEGYIQFGVVCKLKTPIAAPTFEGQASQDGQGDSGAVGAPPPSMPDTGAPLPDPEP